LIAETFLQLVEDSPKAADVCSVVLMTSDKLLTSAVNSRLSAVSNASMLSNIQELKGLINTLISDVDERVIVRLKANAARLFFVPDETDGLYYRDHIHRRIVETFQAELSSIPDGTIPDEATYRCDGQWFINDPHFVRKEVGRIFWATRIDIVTKVIKIVLDDSAQINMYVYRRVVKRTVVQTRRDAHGCRQL
jgi:hypothetical protein